MSLLLPHEVIEKIEKLRWNRKFFPGNASFADLDCLTGRRGKRPGGFTEFPEPDAR
jgi:hypothetical protein